MASTVLEMLPASAATEYDKGEVIYLPDSLPDSLYLVVTGKVKISHIGRDGSEVLLEIVRPDEFFGESALLDVPRRSEQATAIEKATLRTWAFSGPEDLVTNRPPLAAALLQSLAERNADFIGRIRSFSTDTVERRLARALIRFSERLGTLEQDGAVRMMPLTHTLLSRYVGTSREIVTGHMNRLRKRGYVSYSRESIRLYRDALKASIS